jgi:S1-C subfamily serine protease/thiol-disulfide isomerase/thioredoxin
MPMPRPFAVLALLAAVAAARADTPPAPAVPWYVDDDQFLDDFTDRLAELAAAGKCLSPDEVVKRTAADRTCRLAPAAPGTAALAPDEVYRRALPSVFVIGCVKKGAKEGEYTDGWFGTAWAVAADGVLVTNWHVFDHADGMSYAAVNHRGEVFPLTDVLAVDRRADIAVVRVAGTGFTPLPVAAGPPPVGAWVGVLSHPGNQPFTFTQGGVTRYARHFGGPEAFGERWMGVSAEYAGGSSGGPVLDRTGAVVGMACLTSNIDYEGDEPKPASKRPAVGPDNPPPAESKVQMVVKLAVPVGAIRRTLGAPVAGGDEAAAPPGDPAAQAAALKARYDRSHARLSKRLTATEDEAAADRLTKQLGDLERGYGRGLLAIARGNPTDPQAAAVLAEAAAHADDGTADAAVRLLAEHHAKSDKLGGLLVRLGREPTAAGEDLLDAVAEKSPHRAMRGVALYSLGLIAHRGAREAATETDRKTGRLAAAERYEAVAADYADLTPDGEKETLGTLVRRRQAGLANLDKLAVGGTAPDVVGTDLDGTPFKLGDYRGKVVLVNFWATWCGPCMDMAPRHTDLMKRMKGRPFALVGVNADTDPAARDKVIEDTGIGWRSFQNAGKAGEPTVADAWNVDEYPTLYLLDAAGVVRHVWAGSADAAEVSEAVQKLVAEAEKK